MRSFVTFLSLFLLAAPSVFASPVPECTTELCGSKDFRNSLTKPLGAASSHGKTDNSVRSTSEGTVGALTNAQRFARGLPPKKPKLVKGSPVRRVQSSPTPLTSYRGYVQVSRADGVENRVYLARLRAAGSSYFPGVTWNVTDALIVNFKLPTGEARGSTLDFTFESSAAPGNYPYLGLVQGRDDVDSNIAVGSWHYLYTTATGQTAPNATPQNPGNSWSYVFGKPRTSESAIVRLPSIALARTTLISLDLVRKWSFDSATNAITAQWINTDGSKPPTYLWLEGITNALRATADPGQVDAKYPGIGFTVVTPDLELQVRPDIVGEYIDTLVFLSVS
ncbi:hypothetical protein FS837_008686 [Tulasnella sp. UAMH 9824]|nr:hypothetical protein FS837_008686 [Tulasnella sp. UAMH 9824]